VPFQSNKDGALLKTDHERLPRQPESAGKSTTSRALVVSISLGCLVLPHLAAVVNAAPPEEVSVKELKPDETETEDYDPWESFNEMMFNFNYYILDRYVIKPVAKAYTQIVLDGEKQAIHNLFDNIAMPRRFLNSLLQGKFKGAGRELARFMINSTLGVAGFADVAKYQFHIERSNEDTGQTFGYYGAGAGPYLGAFDRARRHRLCVRHCDGPAHLLLSYHRPAR
jgi:phospholipid-binding lipoprotein MlaA